MSYVDGFIIPISKKDLAAYRKVSKASGKLWMEHGALSYWENELEESNMEFGVPFPKLAKTKAGETVLISWITYKNKAHRNRVNKAVLADPRLQKIESLITFKLTRMSFGGFKNLVEMNKK